MDVIRKAADPKCSLHLVNSINTIDHILANGPELAKRTLKGLFGLSGLEHEGDFASVLMVSVVFGFIFMINNPLFVDAPWMVAGQMLGSRISQCKI